MWWRLMAPGCLASAYLLIWRSASYYLGRQAGILCINTCRQNQVPIASAFRRLAKSSYLYMVLPSGEVLHERHKLGREQP